MHRTRTYGDDIVNHPNTYNLANTLVYCSLYLVLYVRDRNESDHRQHNDLLCHSRSVVLNL